MISTKGLAKSFGDVDAVKDVSFNASNGQVTGLLGPNGAGKSTTLRIIYGLLRQDAGVAEVDGIDILNETRKAQGLMGVLPDTHGLYIRLTAREHIHYFGRLHGVDENTLEKSTASHMMHEVSRLCDHIVIISEGTVVASGTTDEIRSAAQEDNLEEAFVKLVETVID